MKEDLYTDRYDYKSDLFDVDHVNPNPVAQFQLWLEEVKNSGNPDYHSMSVSSVNEDGFPTSRIVLLREISDEGGLIFYTNYNSDKGAEFQQSDKVGVLFFWPEMFRQVRIDCRISKISAEASDKYFYSRPYESQLGAHASDQSSRLSKRDDLEKQIEELRNTYTEGNVPRPENWGGYEMKPEKFEFWQGRESRLHDRIVFKKEGDSWDIFRLAP